MRANTSNRACLPFQHSGPEYRSQSPISVVKTSVHLRFALGDVAFRITETEKEFPVVILERNIGRILNDIKK